MRWPLYRGQNEWGKVLLVDTNVAFIKRWPSYRVTTIVRFHCNMIPSAKIMCDGVYVQIVGGTGSKEKKKNTNLHL